ncbi:MAG TPA: LpqB family beta-propeller domain-containing protein [Candidatus Limnocylindria bacterium]|nr:LpqB family beta-propeller domain-containing protein [Candidatus Limnocylindria bacterium]
MRAREALFGAIAVALVVGYGVLGSRLSPALLPGGTISPTPAKPTSAVSAPRIPGTIAFTLRGDIYVLRDGKYANVTSEGRSRSPSLSPDGRTLVFARTETIDGKRAVDGQIVPALLHYSDIVRKDSSGGVEAVVVTGLRAKAANGFHLVAFEDNPALSPDGSRLAVVVDLGDGNGSNLELYDAKTNRRISLLSRGSDLADPSWSPDGKTIVVTSYTLGPPRLLLVPADGRAATPQQVAAEGEPYRASYSSDGKWLVYTLRHPTGGNDIHAVEVSTGRDVALTSDGKSWNGVFSPDDARIAFLHEAGGVIDLYAMELNGALTGGTPKTPVKLTNGEGIDGESRPSWGR